MELQVCFLLHVLVSVNIRSFHVLHVVVMTS